MGKVRRGLKKRRDDYSNEKYGSSDSSGPPDDRTINPKAGRTMLLRPKFNEGPMVLRPWNALDYDDPDNNLERGRIGAEPNALGKWIRRVRVAAYVGMPQQEHFTWNLYKPGTSSAETNQNPYLVFYRACAAAKKAGEFANGREWSSRWNRLMEGDKKGGASISPATHRFFIQGEVYVNGDRDYLEKRDLPLGADPNDPLPVIQLPAGAGHSIFDLLAIEKANWDGNEREDPSLPFKYGDPCGVYDPKAGVRGGLFFTVYNPKKTKLDTKHTSFSGKIKDVQGYEIAISKTFKHNKTVYRPDLDLKRADEIFRKWSFWYEDPDDPTTEGLLYFPSIEEQCLFLAKAFQSLPKILEFAWADHPEFFTREVKDVLSQKRQAAMPGMPGEERSVTPKDEEDGESTRRRRRKARRDTYAEAQGGKTRRPKDEDEFEDEDAQDQDDEFEDEDVEDAEDEFEEGDDADDDAEGDEFEDEDEDDAEDDDAEGDEFEDEDDAEGDEDEDDAEGDEEEEDDAEGDEDEDEVAAGDFDPEVEDYFAEELDKEAVEAAAAASSVEEAGSVSDEFDPEAVAAAAEAKQRDKMQRSLKAAKGRADKRTSTQTAPPAEAAASGKKTVKKAKPKVATAAETPAETSAKKKSAKSGKAGNKPAKKSGKKKK